MNQSPSNVVVGVDYSTRKISAVALPLEGGRRPLGVFSYFVDKKVRNADLALVLLTDALQGWLADTFSYSPTCVYTTVEEPLVGGNGNRRVAVRMGMVAGMAFCLLSPYGTAHTISVSTWKKEVCGRGNLKKDEVGKWLRENEPELGALCNNDDEVDAACLALYGRKVLSDDETSSGS